jgi:hypothetical protein
MHRLFVRKLQLGGVHDVQDDGLVAACLNPMRPACSINLSNAL